MRKIDLIVVHCSDSDDSLDIGLKQIKEWHTLPPPKGNGWSDVGYHFIIRRNGKIELGRKLSDIGAHVKGFNSRSIGICTVGRSRFTERQYRTLYGLLRALKREFKLGVDQVKGHYELDPNKTCPNLNMDWIRAEVLFDGEIEQDVKEALDVAKRP